jgi:hypothetical protein
MNPPNLVDNENIKKQRKNNTKTLDQWMQAFGVLGNLQLKSL